MTWRERLWLSGADVTLLPAFVLWFIWQLQFTRRGTLVVFVVWLALSFLLHHDTPKALGSSWDNLWPATKRALTVFGLMTASLIAMGLLLGAPQHLSPNLISSRRLINSRLLPAAAGGAQSARA